jgi:hypothetical protein
MCPMCITAAVWMSASSTAGLTAFFLKKRRSQGHGKANLKSSSIMRPARFSGKDNSPRAGKARDVREAGGAV